MSVETLLWDRADAPCATLLLAHGAGVGMESPFMAGMAARLATNGISVARFEFAYMAARRTGGPKKPPPRADRLIEEFSSALEIACAENGPAPILVGGKSMGGRVAAMVGGLPATGAPVAGVVCLGYPFHPPGKPDALRLAPLQGAAVPVLICQGDRDPFGNGTETGGYDLPKTVSTVFLEDGDHDFKPRGRSPATWTGNLDRAAIEVAKFAGTLG